MPEGSPTRPSDAYLEATDELELKLEIEEDESVRVAFCLSLLIRSVSILRRKKLLNNICTIESRGCGRWPLITYWIFRLRRVHCHLALPALIWNLTPDSIADLSLESSWALGALAAAVDDEEADGAVMFVGREWERVIRCK